MDDKSPNLQLNTPNAGDIASSLPTSSSSAMLLPSATSDSNAHPSVVNQANVIGTLSILATVAVICIIVSVFLTSRGMIVSGLQGMGYYDWYPDAGAGDGSGGLGRRKWVRIPKLWDVKVARAEMNEADLKTEKEESRNETWEKIMPLSAQALFNPSKDPRSFPSPAPRHHSCQVRVRVVISLPSPPKSEDSSLQPLATSEYVIGTVDLPVVRSRIAAQHEARERARRNLKGFTRETNE